MSEEILLLDGVRFYGTLTLHPCTAAMLFRCHLPPMVELPFATLHKLRDIPLL
jgi:hypothetical protein